VPEGGEVAVGVAGVPMEAGIDAGGEAETWVGCVGLAALATNAVACNRDSPPVGDGGGGSEADGGGAA
jgi:hypothetical protein